MATMRLRPLDDAFVRTFRERVRTQTVFSDEAKAHWEALFNHFEGRSDFEIRAYIAQNFKSGNWTGNETWFRDGYTQHCFQGYDHTEFVRSNIPALDDEARSHYNPSNTIGRDNLFPALPVIEAGPAVLNQEQFHALSPAQRQRYQLTSGFGGYRFQRIPNTNTISGGTQGVPTNTTSTTTAVNTTAGTQGTQPATTSGTSPFGIPLPPPQSGANNNVQSGGQPGGTSGVSSGLAPPDLPTDVPLPPPPGASSVTQQGSNTVFTTTTTTTTGPGAGTGNQPPATTETTPFGVAPPPLPTTIYYPILPTGTAPLGVAPPIQATAPHQPPVTTGTTPFGVAPPIQSTVPHHAPVTTGTTPFGVAPPIQATVPHQPPVTTGTTPFGTAPPIQPTAPHQPPVTTGTTPLGVHPVTPGPTPITPPNTSGTRGTTSGTAGTTPGTAGNKAPDTVQPQTGPINPPATTGVTPGGTFPPPVGLGIPPVTPESAQHDRAPPPPGPGIPSSTTGATTGGTVPPTGDLGVPPMTPWNTQRDTAPPPAPGGIPSGTPGPDGSVSNPLQPSASDMQNPFVWRGQVQPPIGTRLREIMILLDEGDIDREMHWETHVTETKEFLEALERGEIAPIGPETALMVEQALQKIRAHDLFNETHYGSNTPNKIVTADMITAPKPRLKYNGKLPLILGRDHKDNEHLQPEDFPTHPRAEMVVNDQWLTDVERRAGLTEEKRADRQAGLSQDEVEWWQLGQNQTPAQNNAALRQEQTFEQCIAHDGVGFRGGWIDSQVKSDGSLTRELFNGARLGDGKDCYARERAVRRAGLQAALRQFSSNENRVANTPWRRVRLPLTSEEVAVMRKNTGAGPARKYELTRLQPHQLQATDGKNDPQGFTANMAQFWANRNRDMAAAREAVVSRMGFGLPPAHAAGQHGIVRPSVLPPISLWGAYVDSGLGAEDEYHRQMLKEMRTTRKLFEREMNIAPRNLLRDMNTLYQQGLDGEGDEYVPYDGRQQRSPNSWIERDGVNREGTLVVRDLDKMEIYWIRFLLTQSINPEMTKELEPRASLFILFADKLASIFNDVSDPLFPDNQTKVSVEDLLDYIHERADGPVQRIKFYAHDVQMWLERLHSQGRCRYQEDWRCYGWVMRPVPNCHPEQLVRWTVPSNTSLRRPYQRNEDVVIVPRFDRLRNWHSLVRRGLQNSPLDTRVEDFFLVLAYRWGVYMAKLTGVEGLEQQWKTKAARPSGDMSKAIGDYQVEFDRITHWNDAPNNPLVRLVKATMPDKANDNTLTAEASLRLVRDNIIKEAVKNDSMLWPARSAKDYLDPLDEKVRPKVWGWARPEVRGKAKRFFSVNRWPVQLQTQRRQGIIARDEDLDTDLLWKPALEDPTPSKYYRPKARPYVDEKVQFRAGHRNFLIGDTPHQKQVVIDRMFAQMGRAMTRERPRDNNNGDNNNGDNNNGDNNNGDQAQNQDIEPPGFIERWSSYLLSRFEEEDPDRYQEPGAKLRKFRPEDIPESVDPRAQKRAADGDAPGQGDAKRVRRRGPAELDDALFDEGDGIVDVNLGADGQPQDDRVPARMRGTRAGAARRGAPGAEAQDAELADEDEWEEEEEEEEEEATWWDYASAAMAI